MSTITPRRCCWSRSEGVIGESYNIGGHNEHTNISVVRAICRIVDELAPDAAIGPREQLISFVTDRPGHDLRYAIDAGKIARELGWKPRHSFESGIAPDRAMVSRQSRAGGSGSAPAPIGANASAIAV